MSDSNSEFPDVVRVEVGPVAGYTGDVLSKCFCYGNMPEDRADGYLVKIHHTDEVWAVPVQHCIEANKFYVAKTNRDSQDGIVFDKHEVAVAFCHEVNDAITKAISKHWTADESSMFGGSELHLRVFTRWL